MTAHSIESPAHHIPMEVAYWMHNEAGQTTASTAIHPDFLTLLSHQNPGYVLDVGCGSGRIGREITATGHHVIGIDPNRKELLHGASHPSNEATMHYIEAFGQQLPIATARMDSAILLAVLGAVGKKTREQILQESLRCIKTHGLIYIAEFSLVTDPAAKTSTGKRWVDVYREDRLFTGETGSVIVKNSDGSPKFIGHHFTRKELVQLLTRNGVGIIDMQKISVQSQISRSLRDNWNVWGYKQA